jgi:Mn2+/Fe2+ NRAMP family transporter
VSYVRQCVDASPTNSPSHITGSDSGFALPLLGGSAAYAVGEALKWPVGLERKAKEAKAFYSVLAVSTLIGLALNFTKLDPIKTLVWAAIINGITAAPMMCFMMLLASRSKVMGELTLPFYLPDTIQPAEKADDEDRVSHSHALVLMLTTAILGPILAAALDGLIA